MAYKVTDINNLFRVKSDGAIEFGTSGAGTATYVLTSAGANATPTWTEPTTGTVTGSGAANRVTYWSSGTNVTSDAGFTYNGAGRVNTDESFGVSKDGADTVADGPFFRLTNAAQDRQYLNQLDASNNIDYWYYNGSTWTQTISLLTNGGATFAGSLSAAGIQSTAAIEATTIMYSGNGAVGAPSFAFASDANTGMFRAASDSIGFATGGSLALTLADNNATFTGNITAPTLSLTGLTANATSTTVLVKDETLGPELVSNPSFTTGVAGWNLQNSSTVTGGIGTINAVGSLSSTGGNWSIYQSNPAVFTPNKKYLANYTVRRKSGTGRFQIAYSYGIFVNQILTTSFQTFSVYYDTNSNNWTDLTLGGDTSGDVFEISYISVKQVTSVSDQIKSRELGSGAFGDELWAVTPTDSNNIYNLNSGNVGIGTTTPDVGGAGSSSTVLSVIETVGTRRGILELGDNQNADTGGIGSINFVGTYQDASHKVMAEIRASGSGSTSGKRGSFINFFTKQDNVANIAERMRITAAGALEIKGSSTTASAQAFITNDNSLLSIGSSVSGSVVKDIQFSSPSAMMYIDGSTGNVGINETSPKNRLEVKGLFAAPLTTGSVQNGIARFSQTSGVGSLDIGFGDTGNGFNWLQSRSSANYATNFNLALQPNGGNVGIGTDSPGYKLSVANASTRIISATYIDGTNGIMSHAGAPNYGLESFQVRGDFISFWTDYDATHYQGTEKMRIASDGVVTIGSTTLPGSRSLRLVSQTNATSYDIDFQQAGTTNHGRIRYTEGASDLQFFPITGVDPNLTLTFGGNSYFSRGNVGIGVTSPNALLSTADTNTYTQEWTFAKGYRHFTTYPAGDTGNYDISTKISFNNLRGITVDYYESGHIYNNGAAVYFRHTRFYIMMESSILRINDAVLIKSTGNRTDGIVNAPAVTVSASLECLITSTIKSGFTHYVAADIVGTGFNRIVSIS